MENYISSHIDHSFEKFLLYLYLHTANCHFTIGDNEQRVIRDKLLEYKLATPENFPKYFKEVLWTYQSHNDFQAQQFIQEEIERFHLTNSVKQKIYQDLEDITMADGHQDDAERNELYRLRKMLGLH